MTAIYDQEAEHDYWAPPRRHYRDRSRQRLLAGVMLGLLLGGSLAGATYVAVHRTDSPALVKLHTTSATTAVPAPRPSWTVSPTTVAGKPVYDKQGNVVPAGTPGAVTADAGPPPTITINGTTAPNPIMQNDAPGVTYTGPNYYGGPSGGLAPPRAVPGYPQMQQCDLYVGRWQIGEQYTKTGQPCDPSAIP